MGKQRDLHKKWKRACKQLDELFVAPEHTVVVHYSCESFYDRENPHSPRVTSIAVRNLDSGQTTSFSIHLVAERKGLLDSIADHYDALECEMLTGFFDNMRARTHCKWMHWNMRDANYGFEALENRHRALGGQPITLDERNRYDLSRILVSMFGNAYIGHPRLEKLMALNHITTRDFLTGQQEADAFDGQEFVKLHQSTLRKVDVLANLAERAHNGSLKTHATWWQRHGRSVSAVGEWLKEHWLLSGLGAIMGLGTAIYKALPWLQALAG
ncbi:hypothetical protein J8I34_19445 [Cupriavidus sp. AcVe19-6a]|nr:hypothetical protein [Cupriavidus sp. AcVe19-6a]